MPTQDDIFATEGDEWYKRNWDKVAHAPPDDVHAYVASLIPAPMRLLEIGCSSGCKLQRLVEATGAEGHGIELSALAVEDGQKAFPHLHLCQGASHDLRAYDDGLFDVVILNYVFHWVDRSRLLKTVSEIDRVLADHGKVVIQDFAPSAPCRVPYHHLPNDNVYTYKQNYAAMFIASQLYSLLLYHESVHASGDVPTASNRTGLSVIEKRGASNYDIIRSL